MRPSKTVVAQWTAYAGLIAFVAGVFGDGRFDMSDLRAVGLAVGGSALLWFFVIRGRYSDQEIYEAGRRAGQAEGYGEGFSDGRQVARPVVVPIGKLQRLTS